MRGVPLLCAGRWEESRAERWGEVFNPSTGETVSAKAVSGGASVRLTVPFSGPAVLYVRP